MSSGDEINEGVPLKRRKFNQDTKQKNRAGEIPVKNEQGETDQNKEEVVNEVLAKLKNRQELASFCERALLLDEHNIYLTPEELKLNCQQKKKRKKSHKPREAHKRQEVKKTFGQGNIGIAFDNHYGNKVCLCCNDLVGGVCRNNGLNYINNLHRAIDLPSCSNSSPSRETVIRYSPQTYENSLTANHTLNDTIVKDIKQEERPTCSTVVTVNGIKEETIDTGGNELNSHLGPNLLDINEPSCSTALDLRVNPDNSIFKTEFEINDSFLDDIMNFVSNLNDSMDKRCENVPVDFTIQDSTIESDTNLSNVLNDSLQIINEVSVETLRPEDDVIDLTALTPRQRNMPLVLSGDVIDLVNAVSPAPTTVAVIELDSDSDSEDLVNNKTSDKTEKEKRAQLECPICLQSLKEVQVMSTTCGHIFCAPCIKECIRKTRSCPNCRKKLNNKCIHPLYINI